MIAYTQQKDEAVRRISIRRRLHLAWLACLFSLISASAQGEIGPGSRIPLAVPLNVGPPYFKYKVYIESPFGGPLVNAQVKLGFPPESWDLLIFCGFPYQPVGIHEFTAYTNLLGEATFNSILGGGCWPVTNCDTTFLISVVVEGEIVAHVGTASIDVVDGRVKKAWQAWCEARPNAPGCSVIELSDAIYWTPLIINGGADPCNDLDGDGKAGLIEALALSSAMKAGPACSEN